MYYWETKIADIFTIIMRNFNRNMDTQRKVYFTNTACGNDIKRVSDNFKYTEAEDL